MSFELEVSPGMARVAAGRDAVRSWAVPFKGGVFDWFPPDWSDVMAVTCPSDFDVRSLRGEIQSMYARVATAPDGEFHFHRGPQYATTMLEYDAAEMGALPAVVRSSFAGVGNPHAIDSIPPGTAVLDIGCGAGTDFLLAARRVGPSGRAIGVDMTDAMRQRALAAAAAGLDHVDVRDGDATRLPVDDRSVDVVISNGVLNLVPEKERAVAEIARVLNRMAVFRLRTSSSARSCPRAPYGISTSGPVESQGLCWKQRSSACSRVRALSM